MYVIYGDRQGQTRSQTLQIHKRCRTKDTQTHATTKCCNRKMLQTKKRCGTKDTQNTPNHKMLRQKNAANKETMQNQRHTKHMQQQNAATEKCCKQRNAEPKGNKLQNTCNREMLHIELQQKCQHNRSEMLVILL